MTWTQWLYLIVGTTLAFILLKWLYRSWDGPMTQMGTQEVKPVVWPTQSMEQYWQKHYSWIPSMECLPRYTPSSVDPSVESLHPNVARDILAVLDETLKEKSEEN